MSNFRAEIHVHISSSDDATEEEVVELNRTSEAFHGVLQLAHPAKQQQHVIVTSQHVTQ